MSDAPSFVPAADADAGAPEAPVERPPGAAVPVDSYRVFISYRRSDAELAAQQVYDRLRRRFGENRIFIDRQILPGEHWERVLRDRLRRSTVFVLLIGNRFAAEFEDRRKRDEPDPLETEIRIALELEAGHHLRVVPVLVGPQDMPAAEALPESVRAIRRVNAVWAHPLVFETAMSKLAQAVAAADYDLRPIDDPAASAPAPAWMLAAGWIGSFAVLALALLPVLGYAVFWLGSPGMPAGDTSLEARIWYGTQYALSTAFGGLAPYLAAWLVAELRVRASLPAFDIQGVLNTVAMFATIYTGSMFLILSGLPGWRLQPLGIAAWFEVGAAPLPQWAMYTLLAGGLLVIVLAAPFLAIFEAWRRRLEADAPGREGALVAPPVQWALRVAAVLLSACAAWLCASLLSSLDAPSPPPVIPVVGYLLLCPTLSLLLFSSQLARSYLGVRQRSWPFRLLLGLLVVLFVTSTLSLFAQGPFQVLEFNARPGLLTR